MSEGTRGVFRSKVDHLKVCELGASVNHSLAVSRRLPLCVAVSTLLDLVRDIVSSRSRKEVLRIAARRVIALVEGLLSRLQLTSKLQFEGHSVGPEVPPPNDLLTHVQLPVPVAVGLLRPKPASAVGFGDRVLFESFSQRGFHRRIYTEGAP